MNAHTPTRHRSQPGIPAVPPEFEERVVKIDRVARVVKGGRRFRFRATVVIGDRKARVGLGIGKSGEIQTAIQKAVAAAKKSLVTVQIVNESIPFSTLTTHAGAKLLLKPARPGTGIIAGGAVRPIIELSGITNILSKSLGSDNPINNAKAAIVALQEIAATDISKLTNAQETAKATKKTEPATEKIVEKSARPTTRKASTKKKAAPKKTVTKKETT